MAAWVFMSMAGLIWFILEKKRKLDLIFPEAGWKNLKIHAKNREWKTNISSTCAVPSISCPKINIFKCCRQLKKRQYVPTISEEVSNRLKTEIKSLKTDKQNLQETIQSLEQQNQKTQKKTETELKSLKTENKTFQKTIQSLEQKNQTNQEKNKTEIKSLKTDKQNLQKTIQSLKQQNQTKQDNNKTLTLELAVDAERERVEELRGEVQKAKDEVQVITEKAHQNETEKKKIIINRDILLEKIDHYQQKLEDHEDQIEKLEFNCPTCHDDFEGIHHGMVVSKNCGHILGESCLRMELEKDAPRCPGCNRRFNEADIMRVYKL